jgi:hypothetical protein
MISIELEFLVEDKVAQISDYYRCVVLESPRVEIGSDNGQDY